MVAEALASADMYLYRVLQEFRQSAPEHKAWVAAVKACMQGTQGLAKAHCPSGLKWGPVGGASAPKETPKAAPSKPAGAAVNHQLLSLVQSGAERWHGRKVRASAHDHALSYAQTVWNAV